MSFGNNIADYKIQNKNDDVFTLRDSCSSSYTSSNYDIRWIHYMHSYGRNDSAKTVLSNGQKFIVFAIVFLTYLFFKNDYYRCTILLFHVLDILFIYKSLTLFITGLNFIKSIYAKGKS